MKKTLVLATSIAVLAGIWTVIVLNVGTLGPIPFVLWPTFVAWAAFFYLGANGLAIRNGLVQLFTGAILSGFFLWLYGLLKFNDPSFIWLGIFVVHHRLAADRAQWREQAVGCRTRRLLRRGLLVRCEQRGRNDRPVGRDRRGPDPAPVRHVAGLALARHHQRHCPRTEA